MINNMKLFLPLLVLFLLTYGSQNCDGAKSHSLYFEDFTTDYINKSYINPETYDISLVQNSDGRNGLKMTIDIIQDIPEDVYLKCIVYARAFGNYIPTGLSIDSKLCQESGPAKHYVDKLIYPLGFTSCPPTKGSYHKDEFKPDLEGLNINLVSGTHLLFDVAAYAPGEAEIFRCKANLVL